MKEKQFIIGNILDNIIRYIINHNLIPIHCIINHSLINTTNVNSIIRIEEHNKLVPKMIMIDTKLENMEIFIVEYLNLIRVFPLFHWGKIIFYEREEPNWIFFKFLKNKKQQYELKNQCHIFNQNGRNNLLHLLALNQVMFQPKLIIVIKLIKI